MSAKDLLGGHTVTRREHLRIVSSALGVGLGLSVATLSGDFTWWLVPVGVVASYGVGWGIFGLRYLRARSQNQMPPKTR